MISETSEIVQQLADVLLEKNIKIVTAESCTGGMLSSVLTDLPGSSQWFDRGFIVYSNEAKVKMLGVSEKILEKFGAVSAECAEAMALGALNNSSSMVAISITGIAGPSGGSTEKPVGLVYFGLSMKSENDKTIVKSKKQIFQGSRSDIRQASVLFALSSITDFL